MKSDEEKQHLQSKYDKLSKLCDELKSAPFTIEYGGKIDEILSLSYSFKYMEEYRRIINNRWDKIKVLKRKEAKQNIGAGFRINFSEFWLNRLSPKLESGKCQWVELASNKVADNKGEHRYKIS